MSKLGKVIKWAFLLPMKAGVGTILLVAGIVLGMFGPTLWQSCSQALTLFQGSSDAAFDPAVLLNPEKELDVIKSIEDSVEPRLKKAQILIRKQQAEINYLLERSRFVEERVPAAARGELSGAEFLAKLSDTVSNEDSATAEDRELFQKVSGPTWIALKKRSSALEDSLGDLLSLNERVMDLHGRLDKRRHITMQLVPDEVAMENQPKSRLVLPELEESRELLENAHETLFKALYSLDPSLLESDEAAPPSTRVTSAR